MPRSAKARPDRHRRQAGPAGGALAGGLESTCLAALATLLVASVLVPTDTLAELGTSIPLVMLWLVLLVLWSLRCCLGGSKLRFGLVELAVLALASWYLVSALVLVTTQAGNGRAALNMMWRWISFAIALLLIRQTAITTTRCRALAALMIALSVAVASLGLYQYFYRMPHDQAAYKTLKDEASRRQWLEQRGLQYYEPGSPERRHLEDRLLSHEPVGTFALANSLAGLLAPWLTLGLAIAALSWSQPRLRRSMVAAAVLMVSLIGFCLVLTKSRTAWLATLVGLGCLALYFWRVGLRLSWRVPLMAALLVGLLIAGGVAAGGLDIQVVSEATKSLTYRLQYWQASWAMILDHPWFGCGPGNFKSCYTLYKLPEASETVSDPHNFILEIWATAGTPALLALAAAWAAAVWQLRRGTRQEDGDRSEGPAERRRQAFAVYVGAAAGMVVALPCGVLVDCPPDLAIFWVGLPAAAVTLGLLHRWVGGGSLPGRLVAVPLIVLLLNLMAAGGISYPGVACSFWLLLAMALNLGTQDGRSWGLGRRGWSVVLIGSMGLAAACQRTALMPGVQARSWMAEGDELVQRGQLTAADRSYAAAAQADPLWPVPWQHRAWLALQQWLAGADDAAGASRRFQHCAEQYRRLDPRSYLVYTEIGHWYLEAFVTRGDRRWIARAVRHYRKAVELYPSSNVAHARLAWALHLAGDQQAAATEAASALRLDACNPHQELKLRHQQLFGGRSRAQWPDAEQMMRQLRNRKTTDAPPSDPAHKERQEQP